MSADAAIPHAAVHSNVPLAPMTTYKVGGSARYFAEPHDLEDLRQLLAVTPAGMSVFVLGRGSNVVISDAGVDGLVVRLGHGFAGIDVGADGTVVAGGATPLPALARTSAAAGRAGLEFYIGIPGSVGGAVRMNAGGHGSDTKAVLKDVLILDIDTRSIDRVDGGALGLGYRRSNITDQQIVVQARFATVAGDPSELEAAIRSITRWRKENQPGGTLNAGSVFKNPEGGVAGAIIDGLGLKGTRVGPVEVSQVHANFLVATKDASASDIFAFVSHIRTIVLERSGVDLEPEIKFVGAFDAPMTGDAS